MNLLALFKKKTEEKPPAAPPRDKDKWITDILESARGKGGAKLWEVTYTTSIEQEYRIVLEGTFPQICKFLLSQSGEMKYFSANALETPRVLR